MALRSRAAGGVFGRGVYRAEMSMSATPMQTGAISRNQPIRKGRQIDPAGN